MTCPECGEVAERRDVRRRRPACSRARLLHHGLRQGRQEGPADAAGSDSSESRAAVAERVEGELASRRAGAKSGKSDDAARARSRRARQSAAKIRVARARSEARRRSQERRSNDALTRLIRDELIARRATLGAPETDRAGARASARSVVRRLDDEPRDDAREAAAAQAAGDRRGADRRHGPAARGRERGDVAGPGFINFRLDPGTVAAALRDVIAADERYGRRNAGRASASTSSSCRRTRPGPLHVGHGRQAALGDAIATLLEWTGWKVTREFYYNDAGAQIENLARQRAGAHRRAARRAARDSRRRLPRRVHPRDRRGVRRRRIPTMPTGDDLERVRAFAVAALREEQDLDLQAFGVKFDKYFLESLAVHRRQGRRDGARRCVARATRTSRTARSGCARPSSATTRIA